MKLKLERPLVFLDIEATGLDLEHDRILELAFCKILPDGSRENKTNRYNPGIPIPPESTEIHGIKDEDVKDKPFFKQHAVGILNYLHGCDLAGFNSNKFDVPLLYKELSRAGVILEYKNMRLIDVGNIFKIQEARTLTAAVKFYCGTELENAHSAEADINATVEVFMQQLEKYPDMPQDLAELALFSNYGMKILDLSGKFAVNEKGVTILNFGKYKGEPAADHLDFVDWMLNRADFPHDTNQVARQLLYKDSVPEEEDLDWMNDI